MNSTAIIYLRRSTNRNQKHSLKAQEISCRLFAEQNGLEIIETFQETKSGTSLKNREALKSAITKAESTGSLIITANVSRLGRSVSEVSALLENSRVKWCFADLGLEADSTMIFIYLAFAQREVEVLSKRTKKGLLAASMKGIKLGNPNLKEARLKAVEKRKSQGKETAERVMPMIEMIRQTGITSLSGIARKLNELNFPTSKGGKWFPSTIKSILNRMEAIS